MLKTKRDAHRMYQVLGTLRDTPCESPRFTYAVAWNRHLLQPYAASVEDAARALPPAARAYEDRRAAMIAEAAERGPDGEPVKDRGGRARVADVNALRAQAEALRQSDPEGAAALADYDRQFESMLDQPIAPVPELERVARSDLPPWLTPGVVEAMLDMIDRAEPKPS